MKLVILDRDGVINQDSDDYIKSEEEWIPLPGSIEAIARLCRAGFKVAVATNQSGLGRGYFSIADLDAMHAKLRRLVAEAGGQIDSIHFCPHKPEDGCSCRKPKPELLDAISSELGVGLEGTPLVGDSLRDLEAGLARGCTPILVRTGKGRATEAKLAVLAPPLKYANVFDDLAAAADFLIDTHP
ncbi:MAG: D-glycero-beta-D-manno-heptose 1,7-bisphosphate 7-phosphatase [Porticoccaceae bacterium]